jgi:hypothetical protein
MKLMRCWISLHVTSSGSFSRIFRVDSLIVIFLVSRGKAAGSKVVVTCFASRSANSKIRMRRRSTTSRSSKKIFGSPKGFRTPVSAVRAERRANFINHLPTNLSLFKPFRYTQGSYHPFRFQKVGTLWGHLPNGIGSGFVAR